MNRQQERRERFQTVLAQMPAWETWSDERSVLTDAEYFNACRDSMKILERETCTIHHVKLIPRSVRRDMARQRSLREFRADHNKASL
jgi:hypothetical protein